jgi:hypothetical protein
MSRSAIAIMLFGLVVTLGAAPRVSLTPRLRSEPPGQAEGQTDAQQHQPAAAELSREETPGRAFVRQWGNQEYEVRSAAEAMPADKWDYRPAAGMTGPRTAAGKARSARNGDRGVHWQLQREVLRALSLALRAQSKALRAFSDR